VPIPRITLQEGDITKVAVDAIVIFGWPLPDAARIAIAAVRATECTVVREVRFVLFGLAAYNYFETRLER